MMFAMLCEVTCTLFFVNVLRIACGGLIEREQSRALPIQMDLKSEGDITICTGLKKYINCRDGASIAVTSAFWGRTSDKICPSDDGDPVTDCEGSAETLPIIQKSCEGRRECKLEAKHSELQRNGSSHCPGVNKYLIANYTCVPDSKGVNLCESAETVLNCPAGWLMELADVFWGRRSSHTYCGATADSIECDSSEYAAKYLKNKCNGKKRCLIKADSATLEDGKHPSCTGISKYLLVNYVCNPKLKKVSENMQQEEESKLLEDTSSKELMGLLEKHLNEIKVPEIKTDAKDSVSKTFTTEDEKRNENKFVARNKGVSAPVQANAPKQKARSMLEKKSSSPFVATEDYDEIAKSILNGPAFTRSLRKAEPFSSHTSSAVRKEEMPSSEKTSYKEDKSSSLNTIMVKDNVPKAEDEYEVSEPSTVRSILARAKEVLKTLDSDSTVSSVISKRGGIARSDTLNAASQVASLAQSLANTKSKKRSKIAQQTTDATVQKSKIVYPRSYKPVATTGTVGFGNTP
ncbi:uncharacterized protein LOC100205211 isoform X1 [Hydra vulgaris]|uniref:uncharacterized protein LOC100205211 isoform X1 n=2 Tax=Hydra vulgaris TaxID=6087 RepID=UPI001F5E4C13|nr:uncharacterized protein LOC100205211 isoform X1 [Hydra vulgaris]